MPDQLGCLCPLYITTWIFQSHCFCSTTNTFQYVCPTIHHMSTNSASADNASSEYRFISLKTLLTLKSDNVHYWIVLFFMSYSSLFIQQGKFQPTTHWTWLLNGTEWNTCLNSWDSSVQYPFNNHTFCIQPLEI